jgi:predicted ATP-grasp superfamily ATP-dependent carboligase
MTRKSGIWKLKPVIVGNEIIKNSAAIILDGNQRSALAATRSLGTQGIDVIVGAEEGRSLASSSRYCRSSFSYPSPDSDAQAFLHAVLETSRQCDRSVLFPMTDVTVNEILLNRTLFPINVLIPFSDHFRYDALSDKEKLFRQARKLAIPMPETLFSSDFTSRDALISEAVKMGFPLVVKAAHSRERLSGKYVASSATYANDPDELKTVLGRTPYDQLRCLVQKRIRGPGIGIFLLARHGDVLAGFAHRRIREKPPSGGVSVLCESIHPPTEALDAASRLIAAIGWHGVAMVEFKLDSEENRPKLIEVNARFWGSLNLAIRAGVDFPFLLYRLALGKSVEGPAGYRIGVKSRWELGDLDHLLIRLKRDQNHPSLSGTRVRKRDAVAVFLSDFLRPSVAHEVFECGDPGPFLFEAKEYVRNLVSRD